MSKEIEFRFNSPENSSGYLLWQVTMLWQRKIKRELDKLDLTHTQFVLLATLAWLMKHNDIITQVDIANQSNTDRMMVSKVLRTLQDKGFVRRQEHERDTRAKTITFTEEGQIILQKALIVVEQVDTNFFSVLQTDQSSFNVGMVKLIKLNGEKG